jgi:YVTN family beta-propeller protein
VGTKASLVGGSRTGNQRVLPHRPQPSDRWWGWPKRLLIRGLWCALAATAMACGDNTEPGNGSAALRLTTSTSGTDTDPDGYTFSLDGNPSSSIGVNATLTLNGLAPGEHLLQLSDIADNCSLSGDNPRALTLSVEQTTEAVLAITCDALPVTRPAGVIARVVALEGSPYGVAVSSHGVAYAALIGSTALIRGDVATMTFVSPVEVGLTPPHVAFNPAGTVVFATLQTGRGLAVVDATTNTLITTMPLGSDGFNLLVGPDGEHVYVTTAEGTLYVVNAATYEVDTTLAVGAAANGLAFSSGGDVLYVSSRDAGTVVAIDPVTNAIRRTYPIGGMPQRLAVSPDGSELYVANEVHGLDVVNVATGGVTQLSFGTAGYGLGLTPDGTQLYVLLAEAGEVRILDRESRAPLNTISVGGRPRNVVFTEDGRTALVTNEEAVVFIK